MVTQYAPTPLPPWAPKRLVRCRADAKKIVVVLSYAEYIPTLTAAA